MAASSTAERREQFASSTEARRERVASTLAEHLTLSIDRASKMLNNIYERLLIIKDKIQSRIVKLEEGGADMSGARARLGESEDLFVAAKASIEAVAKVEVDSSNAEASRETIKEAVRGAKEAIQEAHQSLSSIIQAMKASAEANAEARAGAEAQ
jgi:hypothetical protein